MARVTRTLELPYALEEVFDFLADLRNELSWHPDVESVELADAGSIGLGAEFIARYRGLGRVDVKIVEYRRPSNLTFRAIGRVRASYEHRLGTHGGGTIVETTAETPVRGLAWLLYPLLRGRVRRRFQERGELIAKGLEAHRRMDART